MTKVAFSDPICTTKGSVWTMPKMKKKIFFDTNNKSRSLAFRNFLFYQNIICFCWVMSLFLFAWCFLSKKNHFQLKQLCQLYTFHYQVLSFLSIFSNTLYARFVSHCNNHWWLLGPQKQEILQCLCFRQISATSPFRPHKIV